MARCRLSRMKLISSWFPRRPGADEVDGGDDEDTFVDARDKETEMLLGRWSGRWLGQSACQKEGSRVDATHDGLSVFGTTVINLTQKSTKRFCSLPHNWWQNSTSRSAFEWRTWNARRWECSDCVVVCTHICIHTREWSDKTRITTLLEISAINLLRFETLQQSFQ